MIRVWRSHGRGGALFAAALLLGSGLWACGKGGQKDAPAGSSTSSAPAAPSPQLPSPFSEVRIGAPWSQVSTRYPPAEEVSACAPGLVGGDEPMPVFAPDALNKQRSFCPRAMDIAGITDAEGVKVQVRAAESKGDPLRTAMAIFYVQAQIRGAVRAGALTGGQLVEAIGAGTSPYEAVLRAAVRLYDGSVQFAKAQSSRRVISACVGASCAGVDRQQVRKYVSGAMTLAAIDQEAQRRVGSGACRAAYPKNERALQHLFVAATGGLSGIGLARTSQPDGRLVPDSPATYSTFATRSKLDGDTARLGVRLANGIGKSETYWKGAIVLDSGVLDGSTFGRALVWVEDGRIARIIVNLSDEKKMPGLAEELSRLYGEPAMSDATKTRWTLESGRTATLDLGAAAELVVE